MREFATPIFGRLFEISGIVNVPLGVFSAFCEFFELLPWESVISGVLAGIVVLLVTALVALLIFNIAQSANYFARRAFHAQCIDEQSAQCRERDVAKPSRSVAGPPKCMDKSKALR